MGNGADSCFLISSDARPFPFGIRQSARLPAAVSCKGHGANGSNIACETVSIALQGAERVLRWKISTMTPLDPLKYIPAENPGTPGQIPGDEDNASDLVDIGLRTADTEQRDAVSARYVDEAYAGEDTDENLADLALTEAEEDMDDDLGEDIGPENDAIHLEVPPED